MNPQIIIELKKICHNAKFLTSSCKSIGIDVVGVTKACLGEPRIAKAMIDGGVSVIADSRLANIQKLNNFFELGDLEANISNFSDSKENHSEAKAENSIANKCSLEGIGLEPQYCKYSDENHKDINYVATKKIPIMLLRQPMFWEIPQIVALTDLCLATEMATIKQISVEAAKINKVYGIIVMVELGDLREGILPEKVADFVVEILKIPNIELLGFGANVACLQGISPTPEMLDKLVILAEQTRKSFNISLPIISGGNSSAWKLVRDRKIPSGINQLRLGEAILLGQETINYEPIDGTYQDAIILKAEIIELKEKPVAGYGQKFMKRAILALGMQDICQGILKPIDSGLKVLRRSSDHLIVDATNSDVSYKIGDEISFIPSYEALLAAMTSPFVEKVFK